MDTSAWTCCFGQCLDNTGQEIFPTVSHTAHLHPQGTRIRGSQQDLKEISRTLQDYIIMPPQPFSWIHVKFSRWHEASRAFPGAWRASRVFAGAALHSQAAGLSLHCTAPELRCLDQRSPCSSRGASSCSAHTSTRHWPPAPPEGGLGPPAEQVPTN